MDAHPRDFRHPIRYRCIRPRGVHPLAQLADSDLVELDPERKATMVANLMVVLSGDHSPTPVLNTGSLYT